MLSAIFCKTSVRVEVVVGALDSQSMTGRSSLPWNSLMKAAIHKDGVVNGSNPFSTTRRESVNNNWAKPAKEKKLCAFRSTEMSRSTLSRLL